MWRRLRQRSIAVIDKLIDTSDEISIRHLTELTDLAMRYNSRIIRYALIDILDMAANDSLAPGQIDSAPRFFRYLIKTVRQHDPARRNTVDPRAAMKQWLSLIDPLRIAEYDECGYLDVIRNSFSTVYVCPYARIHSHCCRASCSRALPVDEQLRDSTTIGKNRGRLGRVGMPTTAAVFNSQFN